MWMFPFAIACGNSFILKPSEKVPMTPTRTAELLHDAGVPEGVFNLIHGDKVAVDALLEHPLVRAISFVGSTPGGEVRLRNRGETRQARAGAGRSKESSGGDAGRESGKVGRGDHQFGVRRGGRTMSGGQRAGSGGRCGASRCSICCSRTTKSLKIGDGLEPGDRNGAGGDRAIIARRSSATSKRAWPRARKPLCDGREAARIPTDSSSARRSSIT